MVLAIDLTGDRPMLTTGDTAAVYDVVPIKGDEALWTSKVLDAQFRSRWGKLSWRAKARSIFKPAREMPKSRTRPGRPGRPREPNPADR